MHIVTPTAVATDQGRKVQRLLVVIAGILLAASVVFAKTGLPVPALMSLSSFASAATAFLIVHRHGPHAML